MAHHIFVIHHQKDDGVARMLSERLILAGMRVMRAGQLAQATEGRQLIARSIGDADLAVVLWSDVSAHDRLVMAQINHAVHEAVPTLVIRGAGCDAPAPMGLTEIPSHTDFTALHNAVLEQLRWSDVESSQVSAKVSRGWITWRTAAVGAVGMAVAAAAAWVYVGPNGETHVQQEPAEVKNVAAAVHVLPVAAAEAAPKAAPQPVVAEAAAMDAALVLEVQGPPLPSATTPQPPQETEETVAAQSSGDDELPEGQVVQRLRIAKVNHVVHIAAKRLRIFRPGKDGKMQAQAVDNVWLQGATRTYEHARTDGEVLVTVDRTANENGDLIRLIRWERAASGYWATRRKRSVRVPHGAKIAAAYAWSQPAPVVTVTWGEAQKQTASVALTPASEGALPVKLNRPRPSSPKRTARAAKPEYDHPALNAVVYSDFSGGNQLHHRGDRLGWWRTLLADCGEMECPSEIQSFRSLLREACFGEELEKPRFFRRRGIGNPSQLDRARAGNGASPHSARGTCQTAGVCSCLPCTNRACTGCCRRSWGAYRSRTPQQPSSSHLPRTLA